MQDNWGKEEAYLCVLTEKIIKGGGNDRVKNKSNVGEGEILYFVLCTLLLCYSVFCILYSGFRTRYRGDRYSSGKTENRDTMDTDRASGLVGGCAGKICTEYPVGNQYRKSQRCRPLSI